MNKQGDDFIVIFGDLFKGMLYVVRSSASIAVIFTLFYLASHTVKGVNYR